MATRSAKDACDLLDADHKKVQKMFKDYEELTGSRARSAAQKKMDLARQICMELTVHTQIEDEIFYPACREAIKDTDILDEATVEHQSAKDLIEQLEQAGEADEMFDAKVKVLGEYVNHHVQEEEGELFPRCQGAEMDLDEIGEELSARREELLEELGLEDEE